MRIGQTQYLKQSQNLALTPKLQQSIRLLQLSTLELNELLQQQVLENPFLQIEDGFAPPDYQDYPIKNLDLSDLQSERDSSYWNDCRPTSSRSLSYDDVSNWIEETVSSTTSLKMHLLHQLASKVTDPHTIRIGTYLIDFVEDDGLLKIDITEVAKDLEVKVLDVLAVLSILQSFDPVGVCARSLEESFLIQLREKNQLTETMERILNHISELPNKGVKGVSKLSSVTLEELKQSLDIIRTLSPCPGASFSASSVQMHFPDVRIYKNKVGDWLCDLNEENLPRVYVDSELYHDLKKRCLRSEENAYLQEQISTANWWVKTIHQRSQTILNVCYAILRHQKDFFDNGPNLLKPMVLRDIAGELELHESTVSRAVNNKYVQTTWGVFELKYFFASTVKSSNEDHSNKSIQVNIRSLIEKEDKLLPLSDGQLVLRLREQGITIARRTIAKYREALKIPSSFERRKQAELMTF